MNNQEKIDAYLRGEMTEEERRAFEEKQRNNQDLQAELQLTNDIIDALKERQHKLDCIKEWQAAHDRRGRTRRMWYWGASVGLAACLVVGLFITYPTSQQAYQSMSAFEDEKTLPSPVFSEPVFRGGSSAIDSVDLLIDAKQYHEALAKIEEAEADYARTITLIATLDSFSEEQDYEKSLSEASLYDIVWRKINVLLASGRKAEAVALLRYYRCQPGIYQAEACRLWLKLND